MIFGGFECSFLLFSLGLFFFIFFFFQTLQDVKRVSAKCQQATCDEDKYASVSVEPSQGRDVKDTVGEKKGCFVEFENKGKHRC